MVAIAAVHIFISKIGIVTEDNNATYICTEAREAKAPRKEK